MSWCNLVRGKRSVVFARLPGWVSGFMYLWSKNTTTPLGLLPLVLLATYHQQEAGKRVHSSHSLFNFTPRMSEQAIQSSASEFKLKVRFHGNWEEFSLRACDREAQPSDSGKDNGNLSPDLFVSLRETLRPRLSGWLRTSGTTWTRPSSDPSCGFLRVIYPSLDESCLWVGI